MVVWECKNAHVAQLAEHVIGNDEVSSSILDMGSIISAEGYAPRQVLMNKPARGRCVLLRLFSFFRRNSDG